MSAGLIIGPPFEFQAMPLANVERFLHAAAALALLALVARTGELCDPDVFAVPAEATPPALEVAAPAHQARRRHLNVPRPQSQQSQSHTQHIYVATPELHMA